ncbi:MAG: DUF4097 domain-containing protein [Lachnospiraceae bacterium]|nr:DUF4097 domain-containing protein [Lachnospiraceae bacterium]
MRLARKILIAAGVVLMVAGIAIMSMTFASKGFDLNIRDFTDMEYEEKAYTFNATIENIDIDSSIADVKFFIENRSDVRVEVKQSDRITFDVKNDDGTLEIDSNKKYKNDFFIGGFYTDIHIYVYLPEKELNEIKIDGSVGSVELPAITCGNVKIELSTGETVFDGTKVKGELNVDSSTGSIRLIGVTAGNMRLDVSTGSILFKECEADEIDAHASTGSIKGSLKGDYIYNANSSTGSVSVPESRGSRKCKLKTSTGSIKIDN